MDASPKSISTLMEHSEYKLNPRRAAFVAYYLDPKSQTRGNAKQSAILAGFEETYANNILVNLPPWLKEKMEAYQAQGLLAKAERNLENMLDMEVREQAMGAFGPIYEKVPIGKKIRGKKQKFKQVAVMKDNIGKMKIKADVSTFVAKTVGRKVYGSEGDETPAANSIINLTQINIHPPVK